MLFRSSNLSADLDLYLYVSSGNQLQQSYNGGSSDESFTYSVTSGQTYSVKVDPWNSAESSYNLSISAPTGSGGGGGSSSTDDYINGTRVSGGDASASRTDAVTVSLDNNGSGSVNGSAGFGSDSADYYKFVSVGSGTASFSLSNLSSDLDLSLYNANGNQLGYSFNGSSTAESISYNVTNGETYYLQIDPWRSAESNYELDISVPTTGSSARANLTAYRPQYSVDNHFSDNSGIYFDWEDIPVSELHEGSSTTGPGIRINSSSDQNENSGTPENRSEERRVGKEC